MILCIILAIEWNKNDKHTNQTYKIFLGMFKSITFTQYEAYMITSRDLNLVPNRH